jgi:predicted ATP-binding protein involved in virulence
MIDRIGLRFGRLGAEPLEFDPGALTVFVGPNNSGKSLVLREINDYDLPDFFGPMIPRRRPALGS